MAVGADKPALLVDVGRELMVLDAVRAEMLFLGGVRCAVFHVEIVLEAAVVVEADPVAIVAGEALAVSGGGEKGVRSQSAVLEVEVAGGTAGTVGDCRPVISLEEEMAAEAAPPEQVVGEGERGFRRLRLRDLQHGGEVCLGTEGAPDHVDETGQSEVACLTDVVDLLAVTCPAGRSHRIRMRGLGDQAGVGSFLVTARVVAVMAGDTGEIVAGVKLNGVAGTATGSGRLHRRCPVHAAEQQQEKQLPTGNGDAERAQKGCGG